MNKEYQAGRFFTARKSSHGKYQDEHGMNRD
jgi:hypothetical protein